MSIIQVSCIDQVLTPTSTPVIASGGIKEDSVAFRFCSQWDGFYKTAVFWQQEQQPYHVLLDENNSCLIPAEVLTDEGTIYFGVFGVNDDGVQRTSNVLRYTIERGTITTNTQPSDPTPDVYTQLLAAIAALGDNAGKADKVSNATEGNLASLDANGNLQDSGRKPGAAGGVATLDSDGKVPSGQLPDGEIFLTTITFKNGVDVADHTHAEIYAAYQSGKICVCCVTKYINEFSILNGISSTYASFTKAMTDSSGCVLIHTVKITSADEITVSSYNLGLSDSVTSTSTTTAASSAAVKTAYDKAVEATPDPVAFTLTVPSDADYSISNQYNFYCKVGKMVFVEFSFTLIRSFDAYEFSFNLSLPTSVNGLAVVPIIITNLSSRPYGVASFTPSKLYINDTNLFPNTQGAYGLQGFAVYLAT